MGLTDKYIKMLGLNDEELSKMIDKMPEKQAKELLRIMISYSNRQRWESLPHDFKIFLQEQKTRSK